MHHLDDDGEAWTPDTPPTRRHGHVDVDAIKRKLVAMTATITRNEEDAFLYCFICEDSGFVLHEDLKLEGVVWSRPCDACEKGRTIKAGNLARQIKEHDRWQKRTGDGAGKEG